MEPQKSIVLPIILAIVISGVVFGGLGYYLANSNSATVTTISKVQTTATTQPTIATTTPSLTTTPTTTTDETANWNTYSNTKYAYSIKYPTNWAYVESTTKTGAGFHTLSDTNTGLVRIDRLDRATNDASISFEDYAKIAAIHEIEGFEKLITIQKITTDSGILGYTTTWEYKDHTGTTKVSGPITYFPLPDGKLTGSIQVSDEVQTTPLNTLNLANYNTMLKTFKFTK